MPRALSSNLVVLLVVVLYVTTVVLAMVLIDKAIYQRSKQSLIFQESWARILNLDMIRLGDAAEALIGASRQGRPAEDLRAYQRVVEDEFTRGNSVWRIRVIGAGGVILAESADPARVRPANTWRNSMFFKNFSREIGASGTDEERLLIEYTTPVGIPAIEDLTHQYWLIALLVWASITVAFALAFFKVILPIRRVTGQVQAHGAALLRRPASALERGYNAVATEALAARLSQRVTDLVQTPSLWTPAEFDPPMIEGAREIFGFRAVALVTLEPTTSALHVRAASGDEAILAEFAQMRIEWETLTPGSDPALMRHAGESLGLLVTVTPTAGGDAERLGLIVADEGDWSELPRWHSQVVQAAAVEVRRGLAQMPIFRDYLFRQKSQANINLARSLGHDLTNVIATSKFDILAIQTWLKRRQKSNEEPVSKQEGILAESVLGLLNTTKFMQEIVNIYRAFSYMDEPRWEEIDFNELVAHLCELFRLTLSRRVDVAVELDSAIPAVTCESRLIKLALFNVLTNANQAIKRLGEHIAGTITVTTRLLGDEVEVAVRDTGPGIRGPDGELLEGEALFQVFFLGITTRSEREDKAEGLGLNWVWSIIKNLHGGGLEPSNHPEGGAVFRLRIPTAGCADRVDESAPMIEERAPQELPHD